jgi:hypothetical protein
MLFGFVTSRDNEWIFEMDNPQGVLFGFGHIQAINTPNGFNIVSGGGKLHVHNMNWLSSTGTFIKDRGMSYNTSPVVFTGVHFDDAADGSTLFDIGNTGATCHIVFRDCTWGGSMNMTGSIARTGNPSAPIVSFDSCMIDDALDGGLTLVGNTNAMAILNVTNCFIKNQVTDWCTASCKHADIHGQGNFYKSDTEFLSRQRDCHASFDYNNVLTIKEMWPYNNVEVWEDTTP